MVVSNNILFQELFSGAMLVSGRVVMPSMDDGTRKLRHFFSKGFGWLPNLLPTAIFQEICEGR